MPLDVRELDQRIKKLRKSLKGMPKDATVAEVHNLRTRTRRVESIMPALEMDSQPNVRKLLAGLKAVRKRAGKVRDMDVLTSYVVGLGLADDSDCVIRLIHHLGLERRRHLQKLHATLRRSVGDLRRRLKLARRKLDSTLKRFSKAKVDLVDKQGEQGEEAPLHAMSVALRLCKELAAVPRLGPNNLHAYRLEVKRLRYVLEMADADNKEQKPLIEELKLVQDRIGEWHDWVELSAIAHEVLQHHHGCKLINKIEGAGRKKYAEALWVTQEMRRRYLLPSKRGKKSSGHSKAIAIPGRVLLAASEIVA